MASKSSNVQMNPTLRTYHFLTPACDSNSESISGFSSPPPPPCFDPNNRPVTVNFSGWYSLPRNWQEWVQKMACIHSQTWKQACIYEAILNSTYGITKHKEFILGVSERWNPQTKSFIFPWGEATVTLEDMMVAGYSVLGSPVIQPLQTEEEKAVEEALLKERLEVVRKLAKKATHSAWSKHFKDNGSDIEHEAFLSLWLSRFVFPTTRDAITPNVFPIAVQLARGTKIDLAPAVLASIYRDLSLIKEKMVSLYAIVDQSGQTVEVMKWAPFQLVLVWVWERFVLLRPQPKLITMGEPRFARWDNRSSECENVRTVLDSSGDAFDWRPYTRMVANWGMPEFYGESETLVPVGSSLDDKLLSFVWCLRASELVGLGCIEQYLPHRVARQFGYDQDMPGHVDRCSDSRENAWEFYAKEISSTSDLYIPSRSSEGGVTVRYLKWWSQAVLKEKKPEKAHRDSKRMKRGSTSKTPGSDNAGGSGVSGRGTKDDEALERGLKEMAWKLNVEYINSLAVPPGFN